MRGRSRDSNVGNAFGDWAGLRGPGALVTMPSWTDNRLPMPAATVVPRPFTALAQVSPPSAAAARRRAKTPGTAKAGRARGRTPAAKRAKASAKAVTSAQEVERIVRRLESDWKAAVERHQRLVGQQFHELRVALHVKPGKPLPPYLKDVHKFRRDLDTRIKPKRGRAKDLKRVERALGAALARLPET